jgi:hypothetical protein
MLYFGNFGFHLIAFGKVAPDGKNYEYPPVFLVPHKSAFEVRYVNL